MGVMVADDMDEGSVEPGMEVAGKGEVEGAVVTEREAARRAVVAVRQRIMTAVDDNGWGGIELSEQLVTWGVYVGLRRAQPRPEQRRP